MRRPTIQAAVASSVFVALAAVAPLAAPAEAVETAATTPVVWLCKPGMSNDPCEIPLDTTNHLSNGTSVVVRPARRAWQQRPVDCFYVYPTVSNQLGINATKAKDPEIYSIAKYQAARFSSVCRMYAPVYRQVPLAGIPTIAVGMPTAYADVRQAWHEYLAKHNRGRGVILIGHSQGTIMLRKLIRDEIDRSSTLRSRLVGAILMGGNVTVAKGRLSGGDFANIPLCARKSQTRCVVAYSTYSTDPLPVSFFGNSATDVTGPAVGLPSGGAYQVACTDPGLLSGITRPVGVLVPSQPFAPGPINLGIVVTSGGAPPTAPTTWIQTADRYQGTCRTINGAAVYRFQPTPGSRQLNEFPPAWGTHLVDMNLGLDRLAYIAGLQSKAWLAAR